MLIQRFFGMLAAVHCSLLIFCYSLNFNIKMMGFCLLATVRYPLLLCFFFFER